MPTATSLADPAPVVNNDTALGPAVGAVRSLLVSLDPLLLTGEGARELVESAAALQHLASAVVSIAASRVHACDAAKAAGHRSTAAWLAKILGCSAAEADATLGTSRALGDLPGVDAALRAGSLSRVGANLVAETAGAFRFDPARASEGVTPQSVAIERAAAERHLVAVARTDTLHKLRGECRHHRSLAAGPDDRARHRSMHETRRAGWSRHDDGSSVLTLKVAPERAARLRSAIDPFLRRRFEAARLSGDHESLAAYEADAICDAILAGALGVDALGLNTLGFAAHGPSGRQAAPPPRSSPRSANGPGAPGTDAPRPDAPGLGAPGLGAPGLGAPGLGAPGLGAPCLGAAGAGERGSSGVPSDPVAAPPGKRRTRRSSPVVVGRVDLAALLRGYALADERSELSGIGHVPVASIVALLGDATVAAVLVDPHGAPLRVTHLPSTANSFLTGPAPDGAIKIVIGVPVESFDADTLGGLRLGSLALGDAFLAVAGPDVDGAAARTEQPPDLLLVQLVERLDGRLRGGVAVASLTLPRRHPNAHQRTALQWRDPECAVEGCNHAARLEADHAIDWAFTHHTRLDETDLLCHHHHRRKTVDGWRLEPGTGKRPFRAPGHPRHPGEPIGSPHFAGDATAGLPTDASPQPDEAFRDAA